MANAVFFDFYKEHACVVALPATRRPFSISGLILLQRQSLPTDPIGNAVVTFQGVNANSEIRIFLPDGTEAAGVESCNANHQLTWDVYAPGSENNTVTIRIVHPDYKIKEFTYTASIGAQSIPVQQELDKWYSNPA